MNITAFNQLINAAGMSDHNAIPACRLVLVDDYSLRQAEKATGINRGTISRILKRLPISVCECCGGPIHGV